MEKSLAGTHPEYATESSNLEDVENIASSPTVTKSFVDDKRSKAVIPACGGSIEVQPPTDAKFPITDSDSSSFPPYPDLKKLLGLCPIEEEPLEWKIFSPMHSQMQMELGSPYLCTNSIAREINEEPNAIPVQYGTNATDIDIFLNSILNDPEDQWCVQSGGGCSPALDIYPALARNGSFAPRIMSRTRRTSNHVNIQDSDEDGIAPRRLHLQMRLETASVQCPLRGDFNDIKIKDEEESTTLTEDNGSISVHL